MGEHPTAISANNRDINIDIEVTRESKPSTNKRHQPLPFRPLLQHSPRSSSHSILIVLVLPLLGFTHHTSNRPSSLVASYVLISLFIFGLFRLTLAVPTRMQQQQHQYNHHNHYHQHQHQPHRHQHHRVETLKSRDGGHNNALLHDDDELETIRRSIVEGLGLERIPDPSKANVSQAEYERAHEEYLNRLQMSSAPEDTRRSRLYTFHATDEIPMELSNRTRRQIHKKILERTHRLYFPLKIVDNEHSLVEYASLRFLLHSKSQDDQVEVSIYRLINTTRHLVSQTTIDRLYSARWIELDVTVPVVLWHEGMADNHGLELHFESMTSANVAFTDPVLNVFTISNIHTSNVLSRERRAAPEQLLSLHKGRRTECRGESKKCCRHEMSVVFKDLKGFEFIVQPKNFDAGYCKGRCPPRYNPAHHHALLQSLIWKEDRRKAPRPCCAPSKLAELEILYFDENDPTKLKVSSWKNMRVLECACS